MHAEKLGHWLGIIANFSVLVGVYFLVLEIRAGEESNSIGIQQAYTSNSIQISTLRMSDEFASILEKGDLGQELSSIEKRKLDGLIDIHLAQVNFMRRLYQRGIATEEEFIAGGFVLKRLAQNLAVREQILLRNDRAQQFALEENGIERFIQEFNGSK
ncbi:MAG: hypothetical protein JKY86_03310 [Gammaproteobacteria bacterium]|nr:hypothetical protein [Gammaproteobacteria bacterium]